jgi:hypothetical protein
MHRGDTKGAEILGFVEHLYLIKTFIFLVILIDLFLELWISFLKKTVHPLVIGMSILEILWKTTASSEYSACDFQYLEVQVLGLVLIPAMHPLCIPIGYQ